jgi:hypothetical protein
MLSVIMLSVIMSVVIMSVIIPVSIINVIFIIRMNVIRLNVIRLNVVAPQNANANILTENWKLEQESKNIFNKKFTICFKTKSEPH